MTPETNASRRDFIRNSAGATLAASLTFAGGAHAADDNVIKIGLVGCGGRGTGAAINALTADKNVKLVAMADAFDDKIKTSLASLQKAKIAGQVDVKPDAFFTGFDGYQKVIERCDVVLLCTPPHFRPIHLKAAIEAGKHVFAEKPCAVDAAGVRSVLESCKKAQEKKLSVVSGLCLRFDSGFRETVKRIHGGAIGEITSLQANDYRGEIKAKTRDPNWNDMTWQMRNWYYYTWLSGDFNVEQHVHFLDVCAWVMNNQYPVRAIGMGGRQTRTGAEYGNIYDHFSIVYEYENGTRFYSNTRQQPKCKNDMSALAVGTKGRANISEKGKGLSIHSDKEWYYEGPFNEMYVAEHAELFASIRSNTPINNGEYMAKSTLLAIMGRMAAYTGQEITWNMAMNSKEVLSPAAYDWAAKPPESEVAMPGKTKFI
ncbi:MAG: Gfo/Idh/MocA family oxidoreductase [Planctomycetes bacterium]|nr:Gfo/Idh/MocA family oxidoreductase [Planctomycetota bacterium]